MRELIDRKDAIDAFEIPENLKTHSDDHYAYTLAEIKKRLNALELGNARDLGCWIVRVSENNYECSRCKTKFKGFPEPEIHNYCTVCGSYNGEVEPAYEVEEIIK